MNDKVTLSNIIYDVTKEICEDICRYAHDNIDYNEDTDCYDHCEFCPLNRLN